MNFSEAAEQAQQFGPYFFSILGLYCTRWAYVNYNRNFTRENDPESVKRNAVNVRILYAVGSVSVVLTFISVTAWFLNNQQLGIFTATITDLGDQEFVCNTSGKYWISREPQPEGSEAGYFYQARLVFFDDGPLRKGKKLYVYYRQNKTGTGADRQLAPPCDGNTPLTYTFDGRNKVRLRIDPAANALFVPPEDR